MIIYGSYISKKENLVSLGAYVTLIDVFIAFVAGLLIIPAMYVAQAQGVEIFSASTGKLLSEDTLVFQVLPALFDGMGGVGLFVGFAFFALMSIAALTSSISMLEAPVSYTVERFAMKRVQATWLIGALIAIVSITIVCNIIRRRFFPRWTDFMTSIFRMPCVSYCDIYLFGCHLFIIM